MAPVITWMVDHVRFPQCLIPREVHLPAHPQEWTQRIIRAWQDMVLPDHPVNVVLVQPQPVAMEAHAVAHVLVLQQQQPGFESILLTTVDNAMPGSYRRHATIIPLMVRRETILALAFPRADCDDQANTCDAWLADSELEPHVPNQVHTAQSATAAIHRHTRPDPEAPNPWDNAVPRNKAFPVQLCLQAVLPDARVTPALDTQPDAPQLLWFANDAWKITLEEETACPILPLPDGMHVPDPAYWVLLQSPPTDGYDDLSYTLYLDGAANGHEAGWSVIVVAHHQHGDHFVGCTYGTVHLNPQHPDWVGADTTDNIAAELSAMVFAQNMIMRWPSDRKACIRPDLSLSRTVATAATTCRSNPQLAKMCCALGLWLSKQVDIQEVRGHTGNAWNELADSVAKWAMQSHSNPLSGQFHQLHQLASNTHDASWVWMQTTHPSLTACFPPMLQQQIMHFSQSNKKIGVLPTERLRPTKQQDGSTWKVQVCTANVLATEVWQSQTMGTKRTGQRTLRLDSQWHKAQIHIVGIQEARTPQGRFHAPHYHILASGAKHKRSPLYGCELWIHKTLPVATDRQGHPIILGKATFTVQHADPRRLFVEANLGPHAYAMVVLHAPSLATPSQEHPNPATDASQWWAETSNLYTEHVTAAAQWVFIDANAPLTQGDGDLFGPHGAEAANKASDLFEEFIHHHQLNVPCTFSHLHSGPTTTWTHSTGKKSRKDYVLVSKSVSPLATASWVDVNHDTTFTHEDHLPVVLRCQGWLPAAAVQPPVTWDDQAMLDPRRYQAFQTALNTLPIPTWETQVDDHAALYERQILALGQQFFAKPPGKQRLIQLQPDTVQAIAFKRHILDYGRKNCCMHQAEFKAELRLLEKEVARKVSQDIQSFYTDLLRQLQSSGELANHRLVYKILHRLGRKKGTGAAGPRPLPMLQKPDGSMTTTYCEQQQTWMHQFSQIEAGVERTWDEMLQQHEDTSLQPPCQDLEPHAFPGAWQVQMLISRLKRDKVPGPNLIPPSLIKAGGQVAAKQLSILFAKVAAGSREPLHWKGGVLVPLWKGKTPPTLQVVTVASLYLELHYQVISPKLSSAFGSSLGRCPDAPPMWRPQGSRC